MGSSISACPSIRLRPFFGGVDAAFSLAMLRRSASMRFTAFCDRGAACSRDTGKPACFFLTMTTMNRCASRRNYWLSKGSGICRDGPSRVDGAANDRRVQRATRRPLEADLVNPLAKQFYAEALAVSFADASIFMAKYCSANVYRAFISP